MRHAATMVALVIAGEAIFGLPFLIGRLFRPTLLDVFGITNLQLGAAFSLYGMVAMAAYLPGGPLADRFSANAMMAFALLATAAGGLLYAQVPSLGGLKALFAYWGLTTILLFWSALIRATRQWGGSGGQGRAFGMLDGGRGLLAAVLATVTVGVFGSLLPDGAAGATLQQRADALVKVIWIFVGVTIGAALLVWVAVPASTASDAKSERPKTSTAAVGKVLRNPAVWLQALIVVTAYTGYKGMDDLSLLARDVYGFDDVRAAGVTTVSFWTRPFAAVAAGLIGDRLGGVRTIAACFLILIVGDGAVALGFLKPSAPWMLFMMVVVTGAAVFGLRGLYFAIFEDAGIPPALTGTACGVVSVIGYTPDIFMGPLMGVLTDTYPGALGHRLFFAALAGFACVGLAATLAFRNVTKRNADQSEAVL